MRFFHSLLVVVVTLFNFSFTGLSTVRSQTADPQPAATPEALDLNTATVKDFQSLGLPASQIKKIVAARPYLSVDDFVKKSGLPAAEFDKIKARITVAPASNQKPEKPADSNSEMPPALVNVSTASVKELMTLPGVTQEIANRIVTGRPYTTMDDVLIASGIPAPLFAKLKSQLTIAQSSGDNSGVVAPDKPQKNLPAKDPKPQPALVDTSNAFVFDGQGHYQLGDSGEMQPVAQYPLNPRLELNLEAAIELWIQIPAGTFTEGKEAKPAAPGEKAPAAVEQKPICILSCTETDNKSPQFGPLWGLYYTKEGFYLSQDGKIVADSKDPKTGVTVHRVPSVMPAQSTAAFASAGWHHVVINTNNQFGNTPRPNPIPGPVPGSIYCPYILPQPTGSQTKILSIGGGAGGDYFKGAIGCIRFWDRQLTGSQIAWLADPKSFNKTKFELPGKSCPSLPYLLAHWSADVQDKKGGPLYIAPKIYFTEMKGGATGTQLFSRRPLNKEPRSFFVGFDHPDPMLSLREDPTINKIDRIQIEYDTPGVWKWANMGMLQTAVMISSDLPMVLPHYDPYSSSAYGEAVFARELLDKSNYPTNYNPATSCPNFGMFAGWPGSGSLADYDTLFKLRSAGPQDGTEWFNCSALCSKEVGLGSWNFNSRLKYTLTSLPVIVSLTSADPLGSTIGQNTIFFTQCKGPYSQWMGSYARYRPLWTGTVWRPGDPVANATCDSRPTADIVGIAFATDGDLIQSLRILSSDGINSSDLMIKPDKPTTTKADLEAIKVGLTNLSVSGVKNVSKLLPKPTRQLPKNSTGFLQTLPKTYPKDYEDQALAGQPALAKFEGFVTRTDERGLHSIAVAYSFQDQATSKAKGMVAGDLPIIESLTQGRYISYDKQMWKNPELRSYNIPPALQAPLPPANGTRDLNSIDSDDLQNLPGLQAGFTSDLNSSPNNYLTNNQLIPSKLTIKELADLIIKVRPFESMQEFDAIFASIFPATVNAIKPSVCVVPTNTKKRQHGIYTAYPVFCFKYDHASGVLTLYSDDFNPNGNYGLTQWQFVPENSSKPGSHRWVTPNVTDPAKQNVLWYMPGTPAVAPSGIAGQAATFDSSAMAISVSLGGKGKFDLYRAKAPSSIAALQSAEDAAANQKPTTGWNVLFQGNEQPGYIQGNYVGYNITKMTIGDYTKTGANSLQKLFKPLATGDQAYYKPDSWNKYVPNSLFYVPIPSQRVVDRSHMSTSSYEYQSSWGLDVGVNAGCKEIGKFSLDTGLSNETKNSNATKKNTIRSRFVDTPYALVLDRSVMQLEDTSGKDGASASEQQAGPAFKSQLIQLEADILSGVHIAWDKRIFEQFGTHYPYAVTYGGTYTTKDLITESSYENFVQNGISVGISAEASIEGLLDVGGKLNYKQSKSTKYSKGVERDDSTSNGYGGETSPEGWSLPDGKEKPVFLDLRPLYDLLSPVFFDDAHMWTIVRKEMKDQTKRYVNQSASLSPWVNGPQIPNWTAADAKRAVITSGLQKIEKKELEEASKIKMNSQFLLKHVSTNLYLSTNLIQPKLFQFFPPYSTMTSDIKAASVLQLKNKSLDNPNDSSLLSFGGPNAQGIWITWPNQNKNLTSTGTGIGYIAVPPGNVGDYIANKWTFLNANDGTSVDQIHYGDKLRIKNDSDGGYLMVVLSDNNSYLDTDASSDGPEMEWIFVDPSSQTK